MKVYNLAKQMFEDTQREQIEKGLEKYGKPLNPDDWTPDELVAHAMQENVDLTHYLTALKIKIQEMHKEIDTLSLYILYGDLGAHPENVNRIVEKYKIRQRFNPSD